MLLINGEVREDTGKETAIDWLRGQIPRTLARGPLDPEVVIAAADQLAKDVEAGTLMPEILRFLMKGKTGEVPGLPAGMTVEKAAQSFKRETLEKKLQMELGHLPKENGVGKHFARMPLGVLLHISAGNVDALPAYSVLEGLLAGNINLLKLPSMDAGLSLFLLKKITEYEPRLKDYIYVFDTPSTDLETIQKMMDLANGIVVWGSDEAVRAVRQNAPANARIMEWGHKLSFAYLEHGALPEEKLEALARHVLETQQLLCSSCQMVYLDTEDFEEVKSFGERLAGVLARLEAGYPVEKYIQGKITVEQWTRKLEGYYETHPAWFNRHTSVTCCTDSELELSLQFGNLMVKPLPKAKIVEVLWPKRGYLQTVGLWAETEEAATTYGRLLASAGVTRINRADRMSGLDLLESHDGLFPLMQYSRIVEW